MTALTFIWNPDLGSSLTEEPKVSLTKMGDGYEVRVPIGINNKPEMWDMQFTSVSTAFNDVLNFIRARAATQPFYWKNPLGITNLYVCRKWNTKHQGEMRVFNCAFEQVFESGI